MEHPEIEVILHKMASKGYIADKALALYVHLCTKLNKPLLVEGPPGVGKTEIAKVLSQVFEARLIRLQCYEGLNASQAIYDWNYQRQLMYLRMNTQESLQEEDIYNERFLLRRPLLEALSQTKSPVLLIDEIDRADEEFESFLLEILSDWQVSIPELGTIKAEYKPIVIITSNRVRELSDALRRRCIYTWIDYPSYEKELQIIQTKVPDINAFLAREISAFLQELRKNRLNKVPGIAEGIDWAQALAAMHIQHLDKEIVSSTLGIVLKDWKDTRDTQLTLSELLEKIGISSRMN